jgi:hypothetical protein
MKSSVTALSLSGGSSVGLDHGDVVEAAPQRLLLHPDDGYHTDPPGHAGSQDNRGLEGVRERLP